MIDVARAQEGREGEATLSYGDSDYEVVRPGRFVTCAVTGEPIPLPELRYWSVDRQEPYATVQAAQEAVERHGDAA